MSTSTAILHSWVTEAFEQLRGLAPGLGLMEGMITGQIIWERRNKEGELVGHSCGLIADGHYKREVDLTGVERYEDVEKRLRGALINAGIANLTMQEDRVGKLEARVALLEGVLGRLGAAIPREYLVEQGRQCGKGELFKRMMEATPFWPEYPNVPKPLPGRMAFGMEWPEEPKAKGAEPVNEVPVGSLSHLAGPGPVVVGKLEAGDNTLGLMSDEALCRMVEAPKLGEVSCQCGAERSGTDLHARWCPKAQP